MSNPPNPAKNARSFWYIYALVVVILSIGCVAGDDEEIGEIGVCGGGMEQWSEGRGEGGYLGFYHAINAVDSTSNPFYYEFNPRVIAGGYNTYYVSHWGTGEPARIAQVVSSNPDVIAVGALHQSNQDYFDIQARNPGVAEVTVYTALGAADRIRLYVSDISRVDAYHCCTTSNRARYLTNSEIEIPVNYSSASGERPIGFGILPLDISNNSRLEWLHSVPDPSDLHFLTGPRSGQVTLEPHISGQPLTIDLVAPEDVDGISPHWKPDSASAHQWFVGAVLHQNHEPICAGKYPMRVTTQTPHVCDLIGPDSQAYEVYHFPGDETVLVDTFRNGECELLFELLDDRGNVLVSKASINDIDNFSGRDSRPY
ncbi:hypothetical protein [Bradymonas sediminis]|uniref:Uncharacterized protein n=1 Tax=Bradymonas sediminis TaxID=1548548 RepID=A0A2Z4FLZ0_9DELT|nr:hypothetical protein [Bradymonas sediminis]AWV89850.1 hypothetical protein DN745_11065 [Bradymonas sediminis]TDP76401.1 hypothetical protein DFR33_10230 [Bradymonas sediminis]